MKKIIELYNGGGFSLVMSTSAAGPVGPSWDTKNPVRGGLMETLNINPEEVYFVRQQHSQVVVDTGEHSFTPLTEADGMMSGRRTESLAVTAADCMPIYLHDERNGVRALLHSGWKGTGIAIEALGLMRQRYGSRPADITAVLGPSIGSCCYNVDDERAAIFAEAWGADSVKNRDGQKFLSLKDANRQMLEKAGVERVIAEGLCTSCDPRFGSFRREGADNFTLMFVLSYLNEEE